MDVTVESECGMCVVVEVAHDARVQAIYDRVERELGVAAFTLHWPRDGMELPGTALVSSTGLQQGDTLLARVDARAHAYACLERRGIFTANQMELVTACNDYYGTADESDALELVRLLTVVVDYNILDTCVAAANMNKLHAFVALGGTASAYGLCAAASAETGVLAVLLSGNSVNDAEFAVGFPGALHEASTHAPANVGLLLAERGRVADASPALHKALCASAHRGTPGNVRELLAAGASVEGCSGHAAGWAVAGGQIESLRCVLSAPGGRPTQEALHLCVAQYLGTPDSSSGFRECMDLFMASSEGSVDVNSVSRTGSTLLESAVRRYCTVPAEVLLDHGALLRTPENGTVMEAVVATDTQLLRCVLHAAKVQFPKEVFTVQYDSACLAAANMVTDLPAYYQRRLAEFSRVQPLTDALFAAIVSRVCAQDNVAYLDGLKEKLLGERCVRHALGPVLCIVAHRTADFTRLLLSWGADPDLRDSSGRTPLDQALEHNKKDVVVSLLGAGVDVSAQDSEGRTALHVGAMRASDKTLDVLLRGLKAAQLQAVLDACDEQGQTALMCAVRAKKRKNVACLLQHGADMSKPDAAGVLPVDAAACVPAMAALLRAAPSPN